MSIWSCESNWLFLYHSSDYSGEVLPVISAVIRECSNIRLVIIA